MRCVATQRICLQDQANATAAIAGHPPAVTVPHNDANPNQASGHPCAVGALSRSIGGTANQCESMEPAPLPRPKAKSKGVTAPVSQGRKTLHLKNSFYHIRTVCPHGMLCLPRRMRPSTAMTSQASLRLLLLPVPWMQGLLHLSTRMRLGRISQLFKSLRHAYRSYSQTLNW